MKISYFTNVVLQDVNALLSGFEKNFKWLFADAGQITYWSASLALNAAIGLQLGAGVS